MASFLIKAFGFLGGFIAGVVLFAMLLATGNITVIGSNDYQCTKYSMVGKAPYRHEECVVYTAKEGA